MTAQVTAQGTAQATALSDADRALIEAASDAIRRRYRHDWQEVGAALRTRSGKVFTGVSLDAYLGRMAVCAEAVALGQAITVAGETGIETIVAVRHPPPGEKGGSGLSWYFPWTISVSGKFTPAAATVTTTCPAPGTGDAISSSARCPTGPYALQRSAFIAAAP